MAATQVQSLGALAVLCDQLSNQTRLHLVFLLAKGECTVTRLCEVFKLPQPLMSHHLGLLRVNGLVVAKRKGQHTIYSLADNCKCSGGKLKISLPSATVTVEGL